MAKDKSPLAPDSVYKPRLFLDLEKSDVGLVEDLKVGKKVRLIVTGTVVGLEYSERTDEGGKKRERGSVQLESYRVKGSGDNDFSDLAEDD